MTRYCDVTGCGRAHNARGYCLAHYKRWRKRDDLLRPLMKMGHDEERFWQNVRKTKTCWLWTGHILVSGYGGIRFGGRNRTAHRVSFELAHGAIADGKQIDHICRNRACVNPEHLRAVADVENKQNLGHNARNRSGVRGVSWYSRGQKWMAKATSGGRQYYLGYYEDIRDAERAVSAWRQKHMPFSEMDKKKEAA